VNRRYKNILIFVLVVTGLLVAILYSPIGSPDYYSSYYYFENSEVKYDGGIPNAPTAYHAVDNSNEDLITPSNQQASALTPKYSAGSPASSDNNFGTAAQINSGAAKQFPTNQGSSPGNVAMSLSSGRSGTNSQSQSQSYGFTSISSNLNSPVNNTTTKQSVGNSTADVTDPGGDPTGPPIPVGDGWVFLLLLAGGYAVMKRFVLK
jgi:hypothetical protein